MKKKNYTYIWVSAIVLIFGIITVPSLVERFKSGAVVENDRMSQRNDPNKLVFITLDGVHKKVPAFAMFNQDSILVTEKDYLGKVFIVEFFFTSCPSICPIMNSNLVAVQDHFKEQENFGIASFTIDPDHDTPTVLKEYAEKHSVSNLDWHFLTGDQSEIYELANKGFSIFSAEMPNAPGGFEHAGLFALVDKNGFLRSRMDEFGNPIIYYRGAILEEKKTNEQGETEQISILKEDIKKLLAE